MSYEFKTSKNLSELIDRFPFRTGCVIIDTETTGLYPYKGIHRKGKYIRIRNDRILQLAIIDPKSGHTIFNDYFKPGRKTQWPEAEEIHRITYGQVKDKKTIQQRRKELNEIFAHCRVIIGYNASFDIGFLEAEGIDLSHVRYVIDVMEDFANYYGDYNAYFHSYTWKKLTLAARLFEFTGYDNAHDALADCLATRFVAYNLEERWTPYYPKDYGFPEGYLEYE